VLHPSFGEDQAVKNTRTTAGDWLDGSAARKKLGGCSYHRLKSLALRQKIAVLLEPGDAPLYSRSDVEALAASEQSPSA
jgi:hypothetical protein